MSSNNKTAQNLSLEESHLSNASTDDTNNRICEHNSQIELSIGKKFWRMSMEKCFTDTIIYSSDGQEFHVHRLILAIRCEKLAGLISINQQMNKIHIDSVHGTILKYVLKYIYTGDIELCIGEFSMDTIRDILNAADLFDILSLKDTLTKKLFNQITEENCFDLLKIADDKQMKILKSRILIFICQQYPQVYSIGEHENKTGRLF